MADKTYILLPTWGFMVNADTSNDYDIPPYFVKAFSSKKEIADYLSSHDIEHEMRETKDKSIADSVERRHLQGEERTKALARMFAYDHITFWVITINPVDKENRIGIMSRKWNRKKQKSEGWRYVSYFGGKVWKDQLLFGVYR